VIRQRHIFYGRGLRSAGCGRLLRLFSGRLQTFPGRVSIRPRSDRSRFNPTISPLAVDVHAPNWDVTTRYDFLRQEHFIRSDMAEPMTGTFRARCAGSPATS